MHDLSPWWKGFIAGGLFIGWAVACIAMTVWFLYVPSLRAMASKTLKRASKALCVLALGLLSSGCSAVSSRVSLATNIPLIRTEGTIVRVVNSTGDTLRVRADGHPEFALPAGEEVPVLFYGPDYSAHAWGSSATIVVLGASGAATRSVSVASSGVNSEAWIVGHDDLR